MALKDIVDVQITRQTAAITRVGFGTPLFVYDRTAVPPNRVTEFTDADEVADDTYLTTDAKAALTAAFTGDLRPDRVKAAYRLVGQVDSDDNETLTLALNEAEAVDRDWYTVCIEPRDAASILEVAEWTEARDKLFIAVTADANVLDPNEDEDVASLLLASSFSRTGLIYSTSAASTWPDMAWVGAMLPGDPGSATWAFKRIPGVPGEVFRGSEVTAFTEKRVTRIETIQGLSRTIGGFTSDPGAFIDVIWGLDWLKQRLAEDVFLQLVNSAKIPYTNAGIAIIENAVRARLQDAVERNVIADEWNDTLTVTTPKALDADPNDRANRILRDVRFTARLAGAIHTVIIRGVATV